MKQGAPLASAGGTLADIGQASWSDNHPSGLELAPPPRSEHPSDPRDNLACSPGGKCGGGQIEPDTGGVATARKGGRKSRLSFSPAKQAKLRESKQKKGNPSPLNPLAIFSRLFAFFAGQTS